jgi:hypothetical protein
MHIVSLCFRWWTRMLTSPTWKEIQLERVQLQKTGQAGMNFWTSSIMNVIRAFWEGLERVYHLRVVSSREFTKISSDSRNKANNSKHSSFLRLIWRNLTTSRLVSCLWWRSATESGCMWSYKHVGHRIGNLGQFWKQVSHGFEFQLLLLIISVPIIRITWSLSSS